MRPVERIKPFAEPGIRAPAKLSGPLILSRPWLPEGRLLRDALWVAAGHGAGAIATLIGVRLVTEFAPAALYGAFVLLNGILALLQGVLLQPMAQAALRFYPDYATFGATRELNRHLAMVFARRWGWSLAGIAVACGIDRMVFHYLSPLTWFLLAVALGLEAWKALEIVMRNASRGQAAYAALYAADSIARPAGTVLAAWGLGASIDSLLFGQSVGALVALAHVAVFSRRREAGSSWTCDRSYPDVQRLARGMDRFAAPLYLVPIVGWVSGLADRYIVGAVLGIAQAGVYAAAYGLASRPMLMVGSVSEATMRQALYRAALQDDRSGLRKTMALWIAVNLVGAGALAVLLTTSNGLIVRLMLAEEYRSAAAGVLPWIASGYVFLLASQPIERLLYARGSTGSVTLIQTASSGFAAVAASAGAWCGGLAGVAAAVPVYFALQSLLTLAAAIRIRGKLPPLGLPPRENLNHHQGEEGTKDQALTPSP